MDVQTVGVPSQPVVAKTKNKSDAGVAALTGLLAGGATGYYIGEPMSSVKLTNLDSDTFEKGIRHSNKMSPDEKGIFESIKETMKLKETFNSSIEEATKEYFNGKNELTVSEFLSQSTGGKAKTPEELTTRIANQESYGESVAKKINELKDELIDLHEKTPKTAEELLNHNHKIEETTKNLESLSSRLGQHYENIAKNKEYLEIAGLAEKGKISQAEFANYSKIKVNGALNENIAEYSKYIEKYLPKMESLKKAGIYGGIAAAGLFIGSKIFGSKPAPKTEQNIEQIPEQVQQPPTNS